MRRLLLSILLCFPVWVQAQNLPHEGQLIGILTTDAGLLKTRSYQYGKASDLDVYQVLPIVRAFGTVRQQRRAARLQRTGKQFSTLFLTGACATLSAGFFGPSQLQTRQIAFLSGGGLVTISLIINFIHERKLRRLVEAYNDTLLAQMPYIPTITDKPYLTLADTITQDGNHLAYRGLPDVLPTRIPGYDSKRLQPQPGILGGVGAGLAFVGSLLMTGAAVVSVQPGDYRRIAGIGAGVSAVSLGILLPIRRQVAHRRAKAVIEYNEFVRSKSRD